MENKKLFVGNLAFSATEEDVHRLFSRCGTVLSVVLKTDRDTGKPRGFGFVEYETSQEAAEALTFLQGAELCGRCIRLSHARTRPERSRGYGPDDTWAGRDQTF